MTSAYERVCHAMASHVTMTYVPPVISELTKEELATTLISVRGALQVLYTRKNKQWQKRQIKRRRPDYEKRRRRLAAAWRLYATTFYSLYISILDIHVIVN